MENNKTCHLYTYIFLLVLSFFLFSFNVKADTYNVSISSSDFNLVSSTDFYNMQGYIQDYMSNNNYSYYVFYVNQYNQYQVIFFTGDPNYTINNYYNDNRFNIYINGNSPGKCVSNINASMIYNCNTNTYGVYLNIKFNNNLLDLRYFLDTNFDFLYSGNFVLNISSSYNNYLLEDNKNIPSLYYLYSSTPPDNTPTLTAFYTLVIDKFSVIANFFADNTYLFALPLIPIFILCLYLIKRSLIK